MQSEQRERDEVVALEKLREEQLKWREAGDVDEAVYIENDERSETFECIDGTRKRLRRSAHNFRRRPNDISICKEWSAVDCITVSKCIAVELKNHHDSTQKTSACKP